MTLKEILSIFKKAGNDVSSIAYGDIQVPKDFKGSEKIEEVKKLKEEAYDNLEKHPLNTSSYKERSESEEYQELYKKYQSIPSTYDLERKEWLESVGIGEMVEIDQYGGEGQGDNWWAVYHFPKHNIYMRAEGSYASHDGTSFYDEWDSFSEVKPKEKVVTVFERF